MLMKKEASQQLAGVVLYLHTIFVVPGAHSPHVLDIAHPWIASRRRRRPKGFWRQVYLSDCLSWRQIVPGHFVLSASVVGLR